MREVPWLGPGAMDLQHLAALALQHAGAGPVGSGPPGGGARQGPLGQRAGQGPPGRRQGQSAARKAWNRERRRKKAVKASLHKHADEGFALQAQACNSLGRSRTTDHLLPESSRAERPRAKGKGQWKTWTPEALLRAGFAKESMASREVAAQVDGGSPLQALEAKCFVADCIEKEQIDGLARLVSQVEYYEANHNAGDEPKPLAFAIYNMMFDETELELTVDEFGPNSWSVLASHAQLTVAVPTTMWPALCSGSGGLWPGVCNINAELRAVLVTCDAAASNLKLLRYLEAMCPDNVFLLPTLCAQHRNGNVIERATKLLGILPGCFAVAKTLKSGSLMRHVVKGLQKAMERRLVVLDDVPPGLQDEWAFSHRCSKALLDLIAANSDNAEACDAADVPGKRAASAREFLKFFSGPWTGPACFCSACRVSAGEADVHWLDSV